MKTIKISLAVIVIAAITFFVIRSIEKTDKVGEISQSGNTFIDIILQEIDTLKLKPENNFCKEYYDEVAYHIEDHHRYNKLGKSKKENDQWKENLFKQLYAAYSEKFIKQTYWVFNRSEWKAKDLSFIRSEYQKLQKSPMLERDNPINRRFNEIKTIFDKYDEITSFISSCQGFTFSEIDLDKQFPVDYVSSSISRAKNYLINKLENSYVNNCTRLHNELNDIPQGLFNAHCKYLDKKITYWVGAYKDYNLQRAYLDKVWTPLNNEIETLDSNIYNVTDFSSEYNRLKGKWDAEGTSAYEYF